VQGSDEKATREKQCSEERCFSCNRQGHLKRNCPTEGKGSDLVKSSHAGSTVRTAQVKSEEESGMDMRADQIELLRVDGLMAQLRGMSMEERDEMIDALIGQENF